MRWPCACVSAAKEERQPDLAPPARHPARPWPPPHTAHRTPQRAAADAGPALAAGTGRCQRTPAPRGPVRRRTASGTSTDARSRAHASDATSTSDASEVAHHDLTHAPHHDFRDARHRAPPIPSCSRLLARALASPWLPFLVLYFLILMLVLVPITIAAAPPPAFHLHAWAGLPGVCLAGRGRGVQRVSGGPPFLESPGVKPNPSRRRGGGVFVS